jgi:predicted nucleotidyltransferase
MFISKKCKHTFSGYAYAQLQKFKSSKKPKQAAHLIRLLLSCREILNNKDFTPKLSYGNLMIIKNILNETYSYDYILKLAEKIENEIEELYKISTLQDKVNIEKINDLLIRLSI